MLPSNLTREKLIDQIINGLYDAGFDNSASSNTRKIIQAMISDDFLQSIRDSENSLNFSTMEGETLSYFFEELFGIKKIEQSALDNQFQFIFKYSDKNNPSIFIEAGAKFKYAEEEYVVIENKKIVVNENETTNLSCKKITANNNYDKTIECGSIVFLADEKIYSANSMIYSDLKTTMESDFVFIEQSNITDKTESDSEFRLRAKSIFQNLGYNNITIIMNKIKTIFGVYDASYIEHDFCTEIFIMPTSLSVLNQVFETAKEICDYYKQSEIVLRKPPAVLISVEGVLEQFDLAYQEELKKQIAAYIKNIVNEDFVFNRDNFENFIYDFGNSKNNNFILKENKIKIKYDVYSENGYVDEINSVPVISKEIKINTSKTFKNVLIVCGEIK